MPKGCTLKTAEQQFDAALDKAKEKGKCFGSAMATLFNSQVAPALISQLEVSHLLLQLPNTLTSRAFVTLALKRELHAIKEPVEGVPSAGLLHTRPVEDYETRFAQDLRTTRVHPWLTHEEWAACALEEWRHRCSWWEWRAVTEHHGRGKAFRTKAAVVRSTPYFYPSLYKEQDGDNAAYYQPCRMALLALGCFPIPSGKRQTTC